MKILHAYNQHRGGGGADNAARSTIEIARRHGLEVEVYTRSSEELPKNLRGRLTAGLNAVYAAGSVKRFAAILDSFKPDVVHIHEVFPLVSPWILPECTRRGVPVVATCVDYRITCPIVTHLRDGLVCAKCTGGHEYWALVHNCRENLAESATVTVYSMVARRMGLFHDHVTRFIAPSEFTREWLIRNDIASPDRVTTICPIVAIPDSPADAAAGEYIGFAGRFAPEKGIDVLLEAARISGLPFRLARNHNSLVKVTVPDNVHVVVTRDHHDLDEFYRGARAVVVPSIWFETFGLVGAEAMSHAIPIVASRLGALNCLVDEGHDGLLFEPRDANDLAAKVAELWQDPGRAAAMGRAGRAKVMSRWAPEHHWEALRGVYREVSGTA